MRTDNQSVLSFEWYTGKARPPVSYYTSETPNSLPPQEVEVRLMFLDDDLLSAQLSLNAFLRLTYDSRASQFVGSELRLWLAAQRHHAKAFVCSMSRVGVVLHSFTSKRLPIPSLVRQVASHEWKKNSAMFDGYRRARNLIEHLDKDFSGRRHDRVLNIVGDEPHFGLQLTSDTRADVTFCAFDSALQSRMAIRSAFRRARKRPSTKGRSGALRRVKVYRNLKVQASQESGDVRQ